MSSMIGALIVHATVIGFGPPTIVVSILLALSAYVAWSGRHQVPVAMPFKVTRRRLFGSAAGLFAMYMVWGALPGREFDVTGRWVGRTLNGIQIGLELKADGSVLSGTLTRNRSGRPITAGKVSAEGLSFNAMLGRQVESFSGTYKNRRTFARDDRQHGPDGVSDQCDAQARVSTARAGTAAPGCA